jgi:ribosomal protein L7/L12
MAKTEPNKAQAIQKLRLDTGLSLSEGKDVIDEIFARVERDEVEKQLIEPMVVAYSAYFM